MKTKDENAMEGKTSEGENPVSSVFRLTDHSLESSQSHASGNDASLVGPMDLARENVYSENNKALSPEVLGLLEVICEVIMGAVSVDSSHPD